MRILLVDDDRAIAVTLVAALESQHYAVDVADDGEKALEMVDAFPYDLLLLDVMLPKLNGIKVCQRLRASGFRMPILLVTARDSSIDKARGLDVGADDYLIKPFDWQELLARIRTLLRRGSSPVEPVLQWHDLCLASNSCEVTYKHQLLNLTPTEYRLLDLLLRNNRRVFSCGDLIEHLWSFENPPSEETVRSHIKGLRMKMRCAGAPADAIETVYGLGYRLKFPFSQSNPKAGQNTPIVEPERSKSVGDRHDRGDNQSSTFQPTTHDCTATETSVASYPSRSEATLALLSAMWEKFREGVMKQVEILQQYATAVEKNNLCHQLHEQATIEAHKLVGLLGSIGFPEGSQLSREIENLLRQDALNIEQVSKYQELVKDLNIILQKSSPKGQSGVSDSAIRVVDRQPEIPNEQQLDERPVLLIVDSDLELNEQLYREASGLGMRVDVATDLSAARQYLAQSHPDAILLELWFPASNENGLTLLEELSVLTPSVPAIVYTVRGGFSDRLEVARLGARAFLHKPMPPSQVLVAVNQVLQQEHAESAKILIVDDDPQMLALLKNLLEPWGLKLTTLKDPRQFWETLKDLLPDLLVLDVEMPHLNGIELCQVVRNDPAWGGLPILFLTAHSDPNTVQRVFAAGADDFVSKPIVGPELVTRIVIRLERARLLRQLAETDPLTRLANRAKLTFHLSQFLHLADRTHLPLCFAILDLDNFKQVNDKYGHGVGDAVLRWLAELLRRSFRSNQDIVARWGGEEFVVAMYGMNKASAVERLNDVLTTLHREKFSSSDGIQFPIAFSAGVAEYPEDGIDLLSLYRSADAALYQAKTSGRNRVLPAGVIKI